MCQLFDTNRNSGRSSRATKPAGRCVCVPPCVTGRVTGRAAIAPPHVAQDREVHACEHQQEGRRHRGAERAAEFAERVEALAQRERGQRDAERRGDHDRRMAEREEQADRDRPPAVVHQLAGRDVDRRDVIGVHRMTQPEPVRDGGGAEQQRMVAQHRERPNPDGDVGGDQAGIQHQQAAQGRGRRHRGVSFGRIERRLCHAKKSPGRGSKTRARARTKKARPDSDGLDGWQLAAQRRAPPRAYFVFALITASDTFAGVSA
jgi:hypothetical protein